MIKKYFLSNILFVLVANLLVKPLWVFAIDRKVQLLVGRTDYGMYTALLGLTVVLGIVLDVGITNANNRNLSANHSSIDVVLPNLLVMKAILSVLYFFVIFLLAIVLQYNQEFMWLLGSLCILQILNSFVLYLRSNISAKQEFKLEAILSILDKVLMIIVCGYFIYFSSSSSAFTIQLFIYIQIAAYAITMMLSLIYIKGNYTAIKFKHVSISRCKQLMKESLPYALLIFLMGIYMRSDAILLERIAGAQETGIFANAFRILDISNTLGVLFAAVLLPLFTRMITNNNSVEELLQFSTNLMVPIGFSIAIFCFVHGQAIMGLLYHDRSFKVVQVFITLMTSFPAYCITYIFFTLLTAGNSITLLIKLSAIAALGSILLNLILVSQFQSFGTAIAATIVQWGLAFSSVYYSYKKFHTYWNDSVIWRYTLFIGVSLFANMLFFWKNLSLPYIVAANMVLFALLLTFLGFFNRRSFLIYLKQYL